MIKFVPDIVSGTLSDTQITQAQEQNWLIVDNFDPSSIEQACYELRASNIYYELDTVDSEKNATKHVLSGEEFILIKPKQLVTIITLESLKLPDDILGRILTKGKLFSIGILPVNTYADPGFEGQLGIVFFNLSNNYIKINQQQAIAKIEFSKLATPVAKSYRGQHGYATKMWPIPYDMVLSPEEMAKDPRVQSSIEEVRLSHGQVIADILNRIHVFERRLIISALVYFIVSTILVAYLLSGGKSPSSFVSNLVAVLVGVFSNIIFAVVTFFATSFAKRK